MHSTARDVTWSLLQVGAAARALCGPAGGCDTAIQCASLKSNVGHLEAAAAAAGLASLVVAPLSAGVVAVNAQLRGSCPRVFCRAFPLFSRLRRPRRLNAHLSSLVSSGSFQMPVEVLPRATSGGGESRLSSFGFSGTIAHGAFGARGSAKTARWVASTQNQGRAALVSLFR